MKTMKLWRIAFMMLAAFSLASCGSDEPRYADPEAHEKTVQLNEQYGPLMGPDGWINYQRGEVCDVTKQ